MTEHASVVVFQHGMNGGLLRDGVTKINTRVSQRVVKVVSEKLLTLPHDVVVNDRRPQTDEIPCEAKRVQLGQIREILRHRTLVRWIVRNARISSSARLWNEHGQHATIHHPESLSRQSYDVFQSKHRIRVGLNIFRFMLFLQHFNIRCYIFIRSSNRSRRGLQGSWTNRN